VRSSVDNTRAGADAGGEAGQYGAEVLWHGDHARFRGADALAAYAGVTPISAAARVTGGMARFDG
jgi:hypothetical protein